MSPSIEPVRRSDCAKKSAGYMLEGTLRMIRAEYRDMPGLALTLSQAARFFALSLEESQRVLTQLVDEGLVIRDAMGMYRRHD